LPFLTIQSAVEQGTALLEEGGVGAPRLTAEVLLGHALHSERAYLYAHARDELTELQWIHYGRYLNDRLKGKPTQYITRKQEFYGREFYVDERVLIPRPETEHLVEAALEFLRDQPQARVLDVGTGSGAIAVTLALETGRRVFASDISAAALEVASSNARKLGAEVAFFESDLAEAIAPGSIDLLVSNPPYVPGADQANMQREVRDWEPHVALFAGDSGLEIYRRLIDQALGAIRSGGHLLMELGFQSLEGVETMLASDWVDLAVTSDLAGWPRVICATRR
jgi:release factor glutamine methyltransferase